MELWHDCGSFMRRESDRVHVPKFCSPNLSHLDFRPRKQSPQKVPPNQKSNSMPSETPNSLGHDQEWTQKWPTGKQRSRDSPKLVHSTTIRAYRISLDYFGEILPSVTEYLPFWWMQNPILALSLVNLSCNFLVCLGNAVADSYVRLQ